MMRARPGLWLKRALDLALTGPTLVLAAPLMLVVALLVHRRLGRPLLFVQERIGHRGRPFRLLKFRSMREACAADGRPLPDAERLGPFGLWLRATSLDELPSLWNVVRGEMSLVGPRPLPASYIDRCTAEQRRRHAMPPGITGWTAVNGRNALDWDDKFRLDLWYVDHWSLALDIGILARTVLTVLRREGISAEGEPTDTRFVREPATPAASVPEHGTQDTKA
jgi:lipopolysaccharide/colanic/teichoic acid biosynthesis glycosyltransferase